MKPVTRASTRSKLSCSSALLTGIIVIVLEEITAMVDLITIGAEELEGPSGFL